MTFDVFGIETPCIDLNVNFQEMPARNSYTGIRQITWQGGGKVASGMVAAARQGAKCAIAGTIGDDLYGRFCYQDFIRHGVDVSQLRMLKDTTTHFSLVLSEEKTQTRTIMFRSGTVMSPTEETVCWDLLRQSSYLFISNVRSPINHRAIEIAHENGVQVFIDADMYSEELVEHIPDIDILIGSENVFNAMFPKQKDKGLANLENECKKIMERGPKIVVFTFGEKGCISLSEEGYFTLPAFPVKVADTVGAGDVFHGAFLAALLQGCSVKDCVLRASATSAIKCTRIGGRAGIPSAATLDRFLKDGSIDYAEIDQRVAFYERGLEHV